jgi:hypothetical protein
MQGRSDPNRELFDAAVLCRQLVCEGSIEAFLADHPQELFPDDLFSDLFRSNRGWPSIPGDVVASVIVLQALEGLSDSEAARPADGSRRPVVQQCPSSVTAPLPHHTGHVDVPAHPAKGDWPRWV